VTLGELGTEYGEGEEEVERGEDRCEEKSTPKEDEGPVECEVPDGWSVSPPPTAFDNRVRRNARNAQEAKIEHRTHPQPRTGRYLPGSAFGPRTGHRAMGTEVWCSCSER
jgi:hypothetical protein